MPLLGVIMAISAVAAAKTDELLAGRSLRGLRGGGRGKRRKSRLGPRRRQRQLGRRKPRIRLRRRRRRRTRTAQFQIYHRFRFSRFMIKLPFLGISRKFLISNTVWDLFLHLKMSKIVQKRVHLNKWAFSAKNGSLTDFLYNSLISDKILHM